MIRLPAVLTVAVLALVPAITGCAAFEDPAPHTRAAAVAAPTGGVHEGHVYLVVREALSWDQARQRCEAMGGHLACITSPRQNDFIRALARRGEHSRFAVVWLGATNREKAGQWHWITGPAVAPSPDFLIDGADRGEHYMNLRVDSGKWEDYPLEGEPVGEQWFVCQWDP